MRTKSKYRQRYRDGGRVDPQAELPVDPPAEQPTEAVSAPPEAPPAPPVDNAPEPPAPPPQPEPQPEPQRDDATLALQKQIEILKHSEQLLHQRAAQAAMPVQPTREQKLALWRQSGMSDGEADFLAKHPQMIDHADILAHAVNQANQAGHQRNTDAHYDAVKKIFDATLNHLQGPAQLAMPQAQETPKFFAPPAPRPAPNPSRIVSAPVSREVPNSSGERLRPRGQVKLTAAEVEAARISGISLDEYAKQKIRKADMIASGEYGEQPPR